MYLRIKQVTVVTGLSRATIYNMMAVGSFPTKTALGARAVGWLSSEIQNWMAGRKLVEKQGVEAKPARRRIAHGASSNSKVNQSSTAPPQQTATPSGSMESSDWGENDPPPTAAEQHAASARLRLINKMRRQKGVKIKVVNLHAKTFSPLDRLRQIVPAADVTSATLTRMRKTAGKRKV